MLIVITREITKKMTQKYIVKETRELKNGMLENTDLTQKKALMDE